MWQDGAFCDNLDVAANLFLGGRAGRWFVSDDKAKARHQSDPRFVRDQAQRRPFYGCALHRASAAGGRGQGHAERPRLLVLDEPTASLGVLETRQVEDLIAKVKAEGTTILLVSHDVEQVFNLADRILVLRRGRVVADLVPSESHPDDVVAIMSGHEPEATARHQLTRLQNLVDQLASARPNSSLPLS